MIIRYNSSGDLYTIPPALVATAHQAIVSRVAPTPIWHACLDHPGTAVLHKLQSSSFIVCNKTNHRMCHACQLGKHVRLPFSPSMSSSKCPFELLHCDVWTSSVTSTSGFKYYWVLLDNFTHFCWTFPHRHKSDVFTTLVNFHSYVRTQFDLPIKVIQANNGTEFVNSKLSTFLAHHGIITGLSFPYTSPQNGKAKRMLRTINNTVKTLLIHAFMPPTYWVEALSTSTFLINRLPSTKTPTSTPFQLLHNKAPTYHNLRVFNCLCYPNISATTVHKLSPQSIPCVFLGYPLLHKGYRCLNLVTQQLITLCHVILNETTFPFHFRYPDKHDVTLDFLLPPASTPLLVPGAGLGVTTSPFGRPPILTDNEPQAVVCGASPSTTSRSPASDAQARPASTTPASLGSLAPVTDSVHGNVPMSMTTSPVSQVHTTGSAHGTAPVPTAPTTTSSRRCGTATSIVHPVAVTHDEGHTHTMVTRGSAGVILKSANRLNLSATTSSVISPIPTDYCSALANHHWGAAMHNKFQVLLNKGTWTLVSRPAGANVVSGKWVFKHKFHSDDTLSRYKARWVIRGYSQHPSVEYDETFSLVINPATIWSALSIGVSCSWPIHQLDVKIAFLHGNLDETVYYQEPLGFIDPSALDSVFLLQKSLYDLKQAPCTLFQCFASHLTTLGFIPSAADVSLFVYKNGSQLVYLLLYVDDIILTEFAMTDLGALSYFLGISVTRSANGLHLSQQQYAIDFLKLTGMAECHATSTLVDTRAKLSATDGTPVSDASNYRSIVGTL
jgi:transposase InsO family protein